MQKTLIYIGLAILLAGVLWPWLVKLPIGRLPGDIVINRPGLKVYVPVSTMVLLSIVLSILAWFFRK
jgi:hypothetical protein